MIVLTPHPYIIGRPSGCFNFYFIYPLFDLQIKDEAFDEAEKRFRLQERLIKSFIRNISLYLQHIRVRILLQLKLIMLHLNNVGMKTCSRVGCFQIKTFNRFFCLMFVNVDYQESTSVKVLSAISFCDIYTERQHQPDPERFQRAHRCISDKRFTEFVSLGQYPWHFSTLHNCTIGITSFVKKSS